MGELDKFIEKTVCNIGNLTITESLNEDYLKSICEDYFKLKNIELNKNNPIVTFTRNSVGNYTYNIDATHIKL